MSLLNAAKFKTDDGTVTVTHDGTVCLPGLLGRAIPATDVIDVVVEDGQAASKRLTATRVALVGVFALAIKKKVDATKYLIVETMDSAYTFELSVKRYGEARQFAAKAMAAVRAGQATAAAQAEAAPVVDVEPEAPAEPLSPEEELARLEALPWWKKTTADRINERRLRKGKAPLNFGAA